MNQELFWLSLTAVMTALLWLPYVSERILRIGLWNALSYSGETGTAGFDQPGEQPPPWARRAFSAHMNAMQSFGIFAALVLTAQFVGVSGGIVATAAAVFFYARLAHFIVYLAAIPGLRTLSFAVAWGAELVIAYTILTAG